MELTPDTLKQAKEELEAVCTKYNIALVPVVVHQGNRTQSSIEIISLAGQEGQPSAVE